MPLATLPVQMGGWEKFALKNQINMCSLNETLDLYHAIYIRSQENSCPWKYSSTFPFYKGNGIVTRHMVCLLF